MSEIERFTHNDYGYMLRNKDGGWVRYRDHLAEVERLTVERDKAQAGDDVALSALTSALRERDAAQAEVERLTVRLEHAQARIVPTLPHADESSQFAQGKMDAYVTSLNAELHETRERLARVQTQYDEFARVTAKTIDQHQRERDEARQQVYRLQQACGDTGANGQGMRDTSRPTDEDIWREAFMRQLHDPYAKNWADAAEFALDLYRRRWPR